MSRPAAPLSLGRVDDAALGEPTAPRPRGDLSATARIAADVREMRDDMAELRSEAAQLRGAIRACTIALRWFAPRVLLAVLAGGLVVLALLVGGALAGLAMVWAAPVEAFYLAGALPGFAFVTAAVLAGSAFHLRLPGGAELTSGGERAGDASPPAELVRG